MNSQSTPNVAGAADAAPARALFPAAEFAGTVRISSLHAGENLPVVIEPAAPLADPAAWAREHRGAVNAALLRHAAVLFRNFALPTPQHFERFAEALSPGLHGTYGDLPKKEGGRNIYRSTPYPEKEMILFHNESSHLESWPRKQWFYCEVPSPVGGATPLVDIRQMVTSLPVELIERIERKSLMYVRTFTEELDLSWREFFKTDDRSVVEERCRAAGTAFRWLDGDAFQTRTICDGVVRHPETGERVFFNQVQLHHPYCLGPGAREDLIELVGADRLPRNVCYGDGTPIADEGMAVIGRAYEACAVRFRWQQGDVVMLDNMLTAHARDPFEAPRKIVVAMGEMMSRVQMAA
ncbi:alpha-ketoglutarate-dependent taurine dioxygenase [Paraburkholderia sp. BL8N3]|nr:TauD/TfdA family dioxygenase [Paraburkholderia sp. BL8N3]TCK33797.1 alpha-ketoglutarate-dependent taurine dioxygenase [Paraburkholderia sp. BL8N3]